MAAQKGLCKTAKMRKLEERELNTSVIIGLLLPLLGTALGAACVFFMKGEMKPIVQKVLSGFAAGVMTAASVWSLLIPSINMSEEMEKFAFVPAAVGFSMGILFLLLLDVLVPHIHVETGQVEGPKSHLKKTTMLMLAVTLHNIPEGMAIGAVFAGVIYESTAISVLGAIALSIGIAVQNFPEGAIISMPLCGSGVTKTKSFVYGMFSGAVEPVAAMVTILLSVYILPFLPYLLSFAAGAMIYVVVEELIPDAVSENKSNIGTIGFAVGFLIMMILDVALG